VGLELADIFRQYGPAYRQKYAARLLPSHHQAMRAIERCRTEALGGQVFACPNCGEVRYSYHSCRNRSCPKCQQQQTEAWLEVQRGLLLPVPYFLLTFTLPSELRLLASRNQKLIYNLLFRASAQATQKLARDPKWVGGQIGMLGVLHTWTRNLFYHPHVHYLVPGGGVGSDGQGWLPAHRDFFLPVKALSKLFRAAFQHALRRTTLYTRIPAKVWRREWVIHCKSVGNGQATLKYLAPYIHRVAISNRRLVSIHHRGSLETSQVTFQYRPTDTGQLKTCSLSVEHLASSAPLCAPGWLLCKKTYYISLNRSHSRSTSPPHPRLHPGRTTCDAPNAANLCASNVSCVPLLADPLEKFLFFPSFAVHLQQLVHLPVCLVLRS